MINKIYILKVLINIILINQSIIAFAFNDDLVHPKINEASANQSNYLIDSLKNVNLFNDKIDPLGKELGGLTIKGWIRKGGEAEDSGLRSFNHFFDPTQPWPESGLWETATPSIIWAQDQEKNQATWQAARDSYYLAITTGASSEYAKMFLALGQIMHLISDKAVPAHVRNDAHPGVLIGGNHFETWTKKNYRTLEYVGFALDMSIFDNAVNTETYAPITALWDTERYIVIEDDANPEVTLDPIIGLAEFTNANFFSEGTLSSSKYPYPKNEAHHTVERVDRPVADPFRPGVEVLRPYWEKMAAGNINPYLLAGIGYNYFRLEYHDSDGELHEKFDSLPPMDKYVYKDYADILIPRAVGYSAALLDYFFRGQIKIRQPRVTTGSDSSITGLSFSVKNGTPPPGENQSVESFNSGSIELIYSYIDPDATDPQRRVYHNLDTNIYQISGPTDPINSEYIPIEASLSVPVPAGATGFSFTVVFKGTLGSEEDAVAAQVYTFDNSRIAYAHQAGGRPHTSNIYTISPDGTHPYQVTRMETPNPWYFSPAWSMDGTKLAFERETCTELDHDPSGSVPMCPSQYYFREIIITDLLTDQQFPDNIIYELNYDESLLSTATFSPDGTMVAARLADKSGLFYYSNIVVFNLNNGSYENLTNYDSNSTNLYGSAPAWSPAGDTIAYYLYSRYDEISRQWQQEEDIFLISLDGSGTSRLTNDDFNNTQPAWSPDGSWIVFSSNRDGGESMDIWLMDNEGVSFSQLVDCKSANCYSPTFSPDGHKVAFSNGGSIYTVDISGDPDSITEIANPGYLTGSLEWSSFLVPPAIEIQVEPSYIHAYGNSVISWHSIGATEVIISSIAERQPTSGSIVVSPGSTTTYNLTAIGPTGAEGQSVTVIVE